MKKGSISVQTDNIFPIIKKFLYSDQEIFLRELVSNAVDACTKLKVLNGNGTYEGTIDDLMVEIIVNKKDKKIIIRDNGVGMNEDEIEKYINQIAFSGAKEFIANYDENKKDSGIIGHFGLGFYSAFMVSEKVEIISKSFKKDSTAVKWVCDGSTNYTIENTEKETIGTDIVLNINEEDLQYTEDSKIKELLDKYCKFYPIKIKYGTKEETIKEEEEGKDAKEKKITVDNIINNTTPLWKKTPSDVKTEDYNKFYRELYPMVFDEPVFSIHLNIDYPFNLTGILYFPKVSNNFEPKANKIQLYCNQVFVTDIMDGIVPDFLQHLHGVIDSPDIPLNVSRSYLQSDNNVKKISSYITRKVAEKLENLYKEDSKNFEKKWEDLKVFIEIGMITDEKFYDKAKTFCLIKDSEDKYTEFETYIQNIKATQEDKEKNTIVIYSSDKEKQIVAINEAKKLGYSVAIFDHVIDSHFINALEQKQEKIKFVRVDSNIASKLIEKEEEVKINLSDKEQEKIKELFEKEFPKDKYNLKFENMNKEDKPVYITNNEFMRRMKEMSQTGGGGMASMYGAMPDMYEVSINANHSIISEILDNKAHEKNIDKKIKQISELSLISNGLLKGEQLENFVIRNLNKI